MTCPLCQHENQLGAKFCEECATPLARTCSNCGSPLSATAKFCPECAHAVEGAAPQRRFVAPESYTPKHLAEKILTSKAALEGERKQVTVLFVDLKGSMELLADRDPEEARKLLDPVLEQMMEAVHRYEGTVNQVMGDGIMALFGAPLAHEDHAVRACYAALRMQESVKKYAEDVWRSDGIRLQIRVGLNSGEVVVRSVGSDLRMDYTAIGQTTHLAARMEQMATPGTTLIAVDTLRLADGFVQVQPLGPTPVKGLNVPIEVYELTGASLVRSRLQAAAARGLTRFIGRDVEMDTLSLALDQAKAGKGQIVAVVGEPGVGKSRLFWEFTHSHRTQGGLVLEASSVSYGKATTYVPVIDLLKGYLQIEPTDDRRKIREKITGKLFSLDRALEGCLSPFLWLFDVPAEDPDWDHLDPPLRRQRLHEGLRRLILRESHVQPLVLVFEDLHWIDGETQAFLDYLVQSLPVARLLLLVNYRPEYSHGWGSKTYYRQLRIDALSPANVEELLGTLLGNDSSVVALRSILIARTEGNPFFVEESVRSLVETGALAGERGAYRLVKTAETLQIPATAQVILAARIDRLSPEDKRLLQTASVIGKDLPYRLLHAIADTDEQALRAGLARLQGAEFVYEMQVFPEPEYTFKHALTHEVTYGGLLHERRRTLHVRIVEAVERFHEGRLSEYVERLVHHAEGGEQWEKVAAYGHDAGRRSLARSAYREAVAYLERALVANSRLPEGRDTLERSIDVRITLKQALLALGEGVRAFGRVREAEALARTLGDSVRLGRVTQMMFHQLWLAGQTSEARRYGEMALQLAESHGDMTQKVGANALVGQTEMWWGDWTSAETHLRRAIDLLEGDPTRTQPGPDVFPAVIALSNLGAIHAHHGEFQKGVRVGEEAVQVAQSFRHPFSVAYAMAHLAFQHLHRGDLENAALECERGLSVGGEAAIGFLAPYLDAFRGYVHILSGSIDRGLPPLRRAIEVQTSMGFRYGLGWLFGLLGEALLLAGRYDEAVQEAERGLSLAVDCGERYVEANSHRLLGDIIAQRDPASSEVPEDHYRSGLTLASKLVARPVVAHCHLGLGRLYRRTGKRQEAKEHLTTATTMYREMDMTYWLEKAEAELHHAQ